LELELEMGYRLGCRNTKTGKQKKRRKATGGLVTTFIMFISSGTVHVVQEIRTVFYIRTAQHLMFRRKHPHN
jgi:hypothetical protein